jgi:glycosyltransferase involved in cell wall biosynthesis
VRIGYVLKKFPRLSETFILNEILELERQGVAVTVFSLRPPDDEPRHALTEEIRAEVIYVPEVRDATMTQAVQDDLDLLRSGSAALMGGLEALLAGGLRRPWRRLGWSLMVAAEARRRGLQRLHAHFATVAAHVARVASELLGVPFSVTCHAKDIYRHTVPEQTFRWLAGGADAIVTVCDANRRHIRDRLLGGLAVPVETIHNGVDLERFTPARPDRGRRGARAPRRALPMRDHR